MRDDERATDSWGGHSEGRLCTIQHAVPLGAAHRRGPHDRRRPQVPGIRRRPLADVGASARRIAQDREATEELERGRLRDHDDIRSMINQDRQIRWKAIAALAASVHALADYRDRIQRCSARELRDRSSLDRAVRPVSD